MGNFSRIACKNIEIWHTIPFFDRVHCTVKEGTNKQNLPSFLDSTGQLFSFCVVRQHLLLYYYYQPACWSQSFAPIDVQDWRGEFSKKFGFPINHNQSWLVVHPQCFSAFFLLRTWFMNFLKVLLFLACHVVVLCPTLHCITKFSGLRKGVTVALERSFKLGRRSKYQLKQH